MLCDLSSRSLQPTATKISPPKHLRHTSSSTHPKVIWLPFPTHQLHSLNFSFWKRSKHPGQKPEGHPCLLPLTHCQYQITENSQLFVSFFKRLLLSRYPSPPHHFYKPQFLGRGQWLLSSEVCPFLNQSSLTNNVPFKRWKSGHLIILHVILLLSPQALTWIWISLVQFPEPTEIRYLSISQGSYAFAFPKHSYPI